MPTGKVIWIAIAALLFFIAAACVFIPRIGIYPDEVLFVPPVWHFSALGSVKILGTRLPTMLMSYVGADKTYLYMPILKLLPPTTWALRLPVVFIGALTLWLLFAASRFLTGERVAAAIVWIVASDPLFLLTTTFDWGPVALQHLFFVAALFFLARKKPLIFAASVSLGLALWDKGTAIWTLAGLFVSAVVFLPNLLRANASLANAAQALGGFALGALPFLRYNLRNHWATFNDNAKFTLAGLPAKFHGMWMTLNGLGMFGWFVRGSDPPWYSLAPLGIAAAAILVFRRKVAPVRSFALFALSTGLITWLAMLVAESGGTSVHHTILVWPWPHLFAVCVLGYALARKPFTIFITAIVLSNIVMVGFYAERMFEFGPTRAWSDATFKLPRLLPANLAAKKIVATEWSIYLPAIYLTRGKPPIEEQSFSDLPLDPPGTEFLTSAPESAQAPEPSRVIDQVISDGRGRPWAMSFHYAPKAPTP